MLERKRMDKKLTREFIFSGHSVLTCMNTETGKHKTFMIDKSDDGRVHFFKIRGDKDGVFVPLTKDLKKQKKNWVYVGMTLPNGKFITTRGSKVTRDSQSFRSIEWLLRASTEWSLGIDKYPQIEVYHEGFCGRCGRPLTNPESVQLGYGPSCYKEIVNG